MLILIAESKTMGLCDIPVSPEDYIKHMPALASEADGIMDALRESDADELATRMKLSLQMVRKLQQMVYEFPNKLLGSPAIEAFTGVVFKAFSYASLGSKARNQAIDDVRIISSLYGWLRPDDIVKPYRFDFTTPLAPGGLRFAVYWKNGAVTRCLLEELRQGRHHDILNLLPGDAARCIDWSKIPSDVRVWKADFREVQPGGALKTPNSGRLKTLRGLLLRQIVTDGITAPHELMSLEGDYYVGSGSADTDGNIVYYI